MPRNTGANWQFYNGPGFTGAIEIPKAVWFHLRLEVVGAQAQWHVKDMDKPALVINDLKSGVQKGLVALDVLTGATYYSNFEVRETPAAPCVCHLPTMASGHSDQVEPVALLRRRWRAISNDRSCCRSAKVESRQDKGNKRPGEKVWSDMTNAQTEELTSRKPLRLWPGVVAAVLQCLAWFVLTIFVPDAVMYGMFAAVGGGIVIVVWWLFFSRAPWFERVGALALMIVAVFATKYPRSPVHCERWNGNDVAYLLHPAYEPRPGSLGSGHPWPLQRLPSCGAGRRHPARVRSVHTPAYRWD